MKKVTHILVCAACASTAFFLLFPARARAQADNPATIRVQTREVLITVLVLDTRVVHQLQQMDPAAFADEAFAQGSRLIEPVAVGGLVAPDFELLEDGKQQRITHFASQYLSERDWEHSGTGAGRWGEWVNGAYTAPNISRRIYLLPTWPVYMIGYTPLPSVGESCHQIGVKVDRPNSLVYARSEYCENRSSLADRLKGTKLGKGMESQLDSVKNGRIRLSAVAVPLLGNRERSRIQIVLDFPPKQLRWEGERCVGEIGVLGLVVRKGGGAVSSFSDEASYSPLLDAGFRGRALPVLGPTPLRCATYGPTEYETRIELAPGDYTMKLAVSDGRSFGKAEIPVTVPINEGCRLDVGGIVLAKSFRRVGVGAANDFTELPGDYKPLISKGIEVTPTADTEFKQGGAFYFYFEIYNPLISAPSPPKVEAYVRVVDAKTGQIRNELQPLDATPYTKPGDPIIPIAGGIDISNLPPGSYRLEAQATDSAGNSTAWRATNFTIEDKSR